MMDDLLLVALIPTIVILIWVVCLMYEHYSVDCRHDYDEWQPWSTEHAYVQQKQCKKCKFIYTYQERKMGHEHHDVHKG